MFGNEDVSNFPSGAAGAAEAGDVPGVEADHISRREKQHVIARNAGGVGQRVAVLQDDAASTDPIGIGRAGAPIPTSSDTKPAVNLGGAAIGGKDPGDQAVGAGEKLAGGIIGKAGERQTRGGGNERHPTACGVTLGHGLEHLCRNARRDFQTPNLLTDEHAVEAGLTKRLGDVGRDAAKGLDLCAARGDLCGDFTGAGDQGVGLRHGVRL